MRDSYEPAESRSSLFGGNSNWRGPIWMPINYLMVEALQKFDLYYCHDLHVPVVWYEVSCLTGSLMLIHLSHGKTYNVTLKQAALELARRLTSIFALDAEGTRAVFGGDPLYRDPHFRDNILFYEYFHGNNGSGMRVLLSCGGTNRQPGLGASHQTGWTVLVANLLQKISGLGAEDMHSFAF